MAGTLRIAAAVVWDDARGLLLVRKQGSTIFMLPGGKLDDDETPLEAMRREVAEELGRQVVGVERHLGRFTAPAANEEGALVDADLYAVRLSGDPSPQAEIAELVWLDQKRATTSLALAPLVADHVLPMLREGRPSERRLAGRARAGREQ